MIRASSSRFFSSAAFRKNNFGINFGHISGRVGTFLHLPGGLGARWVRASILGRFLDAPGVALGGLGSALGALGTPERVPSDQKSEKNIELCDCYVAKAGRVLKTGSPDPSNVVKTQ